ncbi:hypothetical protein FSP39_024444 [Pinctada imbricata]|uniref:Uncharacterized protein n=1 Tax=Pinctada imbricata TaxID=66713 RepID=A0AA88Y9U8_PINIB|nr:hypothetical protein FSP39_024444 [Pinctada imbricata]
MERDNLNMRQRIFMIFIHYDWTVERKPPFDFQVPVACKYCPCGHQFWNKKFPSLSSSSSVEDDSTTKVRRTERTRRDSQRPDYFNSIVIETQSKRRKKAASTSSSPAESVNTESSQGDLLTPGKKKRGRPKTTPSKSISIDTESEKDASTPQSVQEEEEVDIHADLPPLRLQQFKYILMDLNSKISSQNFKPS